jgi:hypothetical protein
MPPPTRNGSRRGYCICGGKAAAPPSPSSSMHLGAASAVPRLNPGAAPIAWQRQYRLCLNATADAESLAAPAALSRFVQGGRTLPDPTADRLDAC